LSGNAQIMAVSAAYAAINGVSGAGFVRLYSKDGTDWNMFQQINGPPVSYGEFGWSVDLSDDGSTLVVSTADGAVSIFQLSNVTSEYELIHTTADINAAEVCVSGDGSAFGVTSGGSSNGARIFVRGGERFQQRGPTFTGYGRYRGGIALNYNGTIVAIGDRLSNRRGRVGAFQWRDDNDDGSMEWMQMGSYIIGDAYNDYLGWYGCVSITHDGLTLAVGAEGYDKDGLTNRGLVRVFNYDSTSGTWNQSGSDLVGDNAHDSFSRTSLSSDGKYLAVGGNDGGYVKIFEKIGNNYEMIEEKVSPGEGRHFGWSIDISADGATVAIGDYYFVNELGRAYLLLRDELPSIPSGNGNGGMYLYMKRTLLA